jgi:hypothetical protein
MTQQFDLVGIENPLLDIIGEPAIMNTLDR